MKLFIFIILIFYNLNFYAQSHKGIVIYKALLSEENELFKKKDPIYLNAFRASKEIEYVLVFNNVESYFFIESSLESQELSHQMAATTAGYINPVYTNFLGNYYSYKPFENPYIDQNEYVIKAASPSDWVLENETKKIGEFTCYKATLNITTYTVQTTKDKKYKHIEQNHQITAWYTPEIPISTGPMGYGNLPGLILELRTDEAVFGATNINLNPKKNPSITVPQGKKQITYLDYMKLFHDRMAEFQVRN